VHIFPYDWIDFPECTKIGSQDKKLLEVGFLSILPKKSKLGVDIGNSWRYFVIA